MQYIHIAELNGIPEKYRELLSHIAAQAKRREVLAIVLYFMSGLDDNAHNHKNIEANMKKIIQGEYKDYAASNIRGYFDKETQAVKRGSLAENKRLFLRVREGIWRNSALGNILAKRVLGENGIDIIVSGKGKGPNKKDLKEINAIDEATEHLVGEERVASRKVRINQGRFRKQLLRKYPGCTICGLKRKDLLIASHIKSWVDSTANEKLDIYNGLLLCPNHDALFDKQLISFDDNGKIIISEQLKEEDFHLLNIHHEITIRIEEENKKYLQYHRALMPSEG